MHEEKERNIVTATLEPPGFKKEDVQIDVHSNILTVSGEDETKIDETKEHGGHAVHERRFGRFSRSIPVSHGIKEEEIRASLEDGVLNVILPRSAPEAAPGRITVA